MATSPQDRLTAFFAECRAAWDRSVPALTIDGCAPDDAWDRWDGDVGDINARFGAAGSQLLSPGSWCGRKPYEPGSYEILSGTGGDAPTILVRHQDDGPPFREYRFTLVDGEWRIAKIAGYSAHPDDRFLSERVRAEWKDAARLDVPLPAPQGGARDPSRAFDPSVELVCDGERARVEIRDIAAIELPTGRIVVGDLGYGEDMCSLLQRAVAPGRYRCQVSVSAGSVAALRVLFSEAPVAAWRDAAGLDGLSVVGIDEGQFTIIDAAALELATVRQHEHMTDVDQAAVGQEWAPVTVNGATCGITIRSSWADGAYPVWWGLDAAGHPCQLLVDCHLTDDCDEQECDSEARRELLAASWRLIDAVACHSPLLAEAAPLLAAGWSPQELAALAHRHAGETLLAVMTDLTEGSSESAPEGAPGWQVVEATCADADGELGGRLDGLEEDFLVVADDRTLGEPHGDVAVPQADEAVNAAGPAPRLDQLYQDTLVGTGPEELRPFLRAVGVETVTRFLQLLDAGADDATPPGADGSARSEGPEQR